MTHYLTDDTSPTDLAAGARSGLIKAAKLYPAGATTNSESGVTHIDNIFQVLEVMAEIDLPLFVHGEVTDSEFDIFDREAFFINVGKIWPDDISQRMTP